MAKRKFSDFDFDKDFADLSPRFSLKPKGSDFSRKLFVCTKCLIGLCLLPFVYTFTVSFLRQFALLDQTIRDNFWNGVITFIIIYLFVWEPAVVYTKGQKLTELLFNFFKPFVKIAPYLLPVYTILLLIIYGALSWVFKDWQGYFIFLLGFTLALHLVFSAKTIRGKKEDFLKVNYIFGFSLIYIINLLLFSFFLSMVFEKFSFVALCNNAYQIAQGFFSALFNQLFVNK